METQSARQFPNSLDGIQFWTVGRKEFQGERRFLLSTPRQMQPRSMVVGVVADGHHAASTTDCGGLKRLQEGPETGAVEAAAFPLMNQFAIVDADRAKVADALARGMVEQNGVLYFGRHPHPAARAVLLKMHFVQSPQIDLGIGRQSAEFFLKFRLRVLLVPAIMGRGLRRRKSNWRKIRWH